MLTERATQLALGIAAAIIATSIAAWLYSESLANTLLAAVSAAATTATAIMVKELEIAVKQLRFEAVKEAYSNLDNREFKDTVEKKICTWLEENLDQVDWLTCSKHGEKAGKTWEEIRQATRYASISLNKTGFLVYMEFIDPKPLAEELGGLILRSFTCLRPLLVCMRNTSEPPTQPWFMRRFALLLTLYTEHYLAKQWRQYLQETLQWKDALKHNIEAYKKCIERAKTEKTAAKHCLDYLPAAPKQVLHQVEKLVQEGETEEAASLIAECIAERKCSLVWRDWLHRDILAKAKKLRIKPPPKKNTQQR